MSHTYKTDGRRFTQYQAGLHNVGSYQVSGVPWITGAWLASGSEHHHVFPAVAREVTIINRELNSGVSANGLAVHFASTSSVSGNVIGNRHYIVVDDLNDSLTIRCKMKEIWVSTSGTTAANPVPYTIYAELTGIASNQMISLTGSGISSGESIVWGT